MSTSSSDSNCCTPTPVDNLRLPTQSGNIGYQTPNIKAQFDAMSKRYGKLDDSPDSMKPTSFRRGIPGATE